MFTISYGILFHVLVSTHFFVEGVSLQDRRQEDNSTGLVGPFALAKKANVCLTTLFEKPKKPWWVPHGTNIVVDDAHKLVYVVNVKAASTSIQRTMNERLGVGWKKGIVLGRKVPKSCLTKSGRMTTGCLEFVKMKKLGYFFFTFVRNPYDKFLSGVSQSRIQDPDLRRLDVNAVVQRQVNAMRLDHISPNHINEHFQSNLYRMGGADKHGHPVYFDFVGTLDNIARDWQILVDTLTPSHFPFLLSHKMKVPLPHERSGGADPVLSPASKKAICWASPDIDMDYKCLGFTRPRQCPPKPA